MLSPAARTSTIFLRTSFFPHRCWILRTAQPSFSHFRPLSTSRPPLISLEDLLKPTRKPKPNDAPTKNTTNGYGSPPTRASAQLFINRLPAGTARELEEKLREVFGSLGEVPAARVGIHADGRKYAHLRYKSDETALEVLRTTQRAPVAISGFTLAVNLAASMNRVDAPRPMLFFTGFHGTYYTLRSLLWEHGYKNPQIFFFLGSQAERSGDGRIDFESHVNVHKAHFKLNGLKIDDKTTLNLSYERPGAPLPSPSPRPRPPHLTEPEPPAMATLKLPAQISDTELGERMRPFFEGEGNVMSVVLGRRGSSSAAKDSAQPVPLSQPTPPAQPTRTIQPAQTVQPTQPAQSKPRRPAMNTLLVKNLPTYITEPEFEERMWKHFEPHWAVGSVELAVDDEGTSQGFGYVRFVHYADAPRALEFTAKLPLVLDGLELTTAVVPQPTINRTLRVNGYKGSRLSLKQAFQKYYDTDRIRRLQIFHHKTGQLSGNGIIQFRTKASAVEALAELNGCDVEGETLRLRWFRYDLSTGQNAAPPEEQEMALREPELEGEKTEDREVERS